MLVPRTAAAALNQIDRQSVKDFGITATPDKQFEAVIEFSGVRYKGTGSSKLTAKSDASEAALRDFVLCKLAQLRNTKNQPINADEDDDDDDEEEREEINIAEQVPMVQLASFALHKLFSEWEAKGCQVPAGAEPTTSRPKDLNELPPDSHQSHPVSVLAKMRPGSIFQYLGQKGSSHPNILHRMSLTVDGHTFLAEAKSKKDAKRSIAADALTKLFGWKGQLNNQMN